MLEYYLLLIQFFFALVGLFLFWKGFAYTRRMWEYKKLQAMKFPIAYEKILQDIYHYTSLPNEDQRKLQLLILFFIDHKEFIGVKMSLDDEIKVIIAFYAALMRLGFEFGEKDDVSTIIVYPKHFIVNESQINGGIRQHKTSLLEGQSANGTVVISWQDIKNDIKKHTKNNVIIHEFAHELDFEDGLADGTPVLEGSSYRRWSEVFSNTFDTLKHKSDKGKSSDAITLLGTYAFKNEAEFFAVCSERFFQTPTTFKFLFPEIYEELKLFYRLDTVQLFKDL